MIPFALKIWARLYVVAESFVIEKETHKELTMVRAYQYIWFRDRGYGLHEPGSTGL